MLQGYKYIAAFKTEPLHQDFPNDLTTVEEQLFFQKICSFSSSKVITHILDISVDHTRMLNIRKIDNCLSLRCMLVVIVTLLP